LLGNAMSTLYDHMILSPADIQAATAATLPRSDLNRQIERVRVTFQPLSLDELSKLWTGFAMQLRLSAAYEVSVALIDSKQPVRAPLPTLTRGTADTGPKSVANLIPPFPALTAIEFPNDQTSARLNDLLTLDGHDLDGTNVGAVFNHPLWTGPVEVPIPAGPNATATQVKVTIPNAPAVWPTGIYTVQVFVQRTGDTFRRSTTQFPFSLAPTITLAPPSAPAGDITYTATCSPEIRPEQRASLLLGSHRPEILADPHPVQINTLTFQAKAVTPGDYLVRLRVDGVDSLVVNKAVTPPVFDPAQKVTVT
jgi:hypothetical protein